MKIEFKNNLLIMWIPTLYILMTLGLYLIFSDELRYEIDQARRFFLYFASFVFAVVSFYKLFNLDISLTILSDKIIFKKSRFFFVVKKIVNKDEVEMVSIKYNSLMGGRLFLILKNKRKVAIHLDLLGIIDGILPDVELRTGVNPQTNLYLVVATAKLLSNEWGIPFSTNYLENDK